MTGLALEALAVALRADVPALLWGSPGTGKTSAVLALGAALGWPVEVVVGSIREPSDFAGLPIVEDGPQGRQVQFAPPGWARRLASSGHGLLFLDELSTSPPSVQAAMLRVVLERRVGDLELPDGVRLVAAANPPEEAADGWELAAPMANRFVHLDWTVQAAAVAEGLLTGFPQPAVPVAAASAARDLAARAMVASFLQVRPELVLRVPAEAARAGRAWPSPRSWEAAARLLAAAEGSPPGVADTLLRGSVGEGPASEFLSWSSHLDLPDPAAVLADPASFRLPERGDRAYAALTAVAAYAVGSRDATSWNAAWQITARVAVDAPDVAVLAGQVLARGRPPGAVLPAAVGALLPVLRAAGLVP